MNGHPWLPEHSDTLRAWAGRLSDAEIAERTGHSVRTVRKRREAMALPSFGHRKNWTRRDWLLADASGLDFQRAHSASDV